MKKFDVEITETLQRRVSVEAASQEDAERMVTQAWNNQDYVLDSGDFTSVDFKTVGEHELAETRTISLPRHWIRFVPVASWPLLPAATRWIPRIRTRESIWRNGQNCWEPFDFLTTHSVPMPVQM